LTFQTAFAETVVHWERLTSISCAAAGEPRGTKKRDP